MSVSLVLMCTNKHVYLTMRRLLMGWDIVFLSYSTLVSC